MSDSIDQHAALTNAHPEHSSALKNRNYMSLLSKVVVVILGLVTGAVIGIVLALFLNLINITC